MKNLFLLILFFGLFFGAQFVYFENRYNEEEKINFDEISSSIVTIESLNNRGKSFGSGVIISEDGYEFSFDVINYELGMQTLKNFDYQLANSAKGQHIHFIVNNDPYSAHYEEKFSKKFWKILIFLVS